MEHSYEYAVGSVRAKEIKLLRRADLETCISAKTEEQLVRILQDKGYGDAATGNATVESLLASQTAALWDYVSSIAPDITAFDCFFYLNDAHNIKLAIKGILRNLPYEHLQLAPVTISFAEIRHAVEEQRFSHLPEWLADAAKTAYALMAEAEDAQQSDALIDRAAMEQMLVASKTVKSPWFESYVARMVCYDTIKVALRAARLNKSREFIETALCSVAELDMPKLKRAVLAGEKELIELLSHTSAWDLSAAIEAYKQSPSAFEKWVDDRLMKEALSCKWVTVGPEPLLGYVLARRAEIKVLHIIASGIRTGQTEAIIRERVRELYG